MLGVQNILVGLDLHHGDRIASEHLEPTSQAALNQGVELARKTGASLTLCAVLELSPQAFHLIELDPLNAHRTVEDVAAADLEKLAQPLRQSGLTVATKLMVGKSWEQLTRQVIAGEHDLLVVGTRKRSATARAVFGSTCSKLIRVCPVPVWVVTPGEVRELREVLVASDFSEIAQLTTQAGVTMARHLGAKLFLLHALEFPFEAYLRTAGVSEEEVGNYRLRMHAEAHEHLHQQLAKTDYRTVEAGVKVEIVEGTPDAVIPQFIDDQEIDLLVIGTHGRSGLTGMLLGNTAERVLPHVHCSLLAVKPPGFVSPVTV